MVTDIIEEMEDLPEYFYFYDQKNPNVENFIKDKINCKYAPKELIEFYNMHDGVTFNESEIFSLNEILVNLEGNFKEFVEELDIKNGERFIPIGEDDLGGFYVIDSNKDEEIIYYFNLSDNEPNKVYNSLSELLEEIIEIQTKDDFNDNI